MTDFDSPEIDAPVDETALDLLADVPVDDSEVAQGLKDSKATPGWYTTDPENLVVKTGKAAKTGRAYARAFGLMTGPESARIGFAWSWERQNWKDADGTDTGKPDGLYKNYVTLVALYTKACEAKPKKVSDVNAFVQQTPIQVRVIVKKNGYEDVVAFRLVSSA